LKSESNRKLSEDGDSEQWVCLKCSYQNDNPIHCDNCATIRGATGKRDTSAVIPHS
jgi:primosomal protein N'